MAGGAGVVVWRRVLGTGLLAPCSWMQRPCWPRGLGGPGCSLRKQRPWAAAGPVRAGSLGALGPLLTRSGATRTLPPGRGSKRSPSHCLSSRLRSKDTCFHTENINVGIWAQSQSLVPVNLRQ